MRMQHFNFKIVVRYDPKPIPIRTCDWDAYVEDDPELGTGNGETALDAVRELCEVLETLWLVV